MRAGPAAKHREAERQRKPAQRQSQGRQTRTLPRIRKTPQQAIVARLARVSYPPPSPVSGCRTRAPCRRVGSPASTSAEAGVPVAHPPSDVGGATGALLRVVGRAMTRGVASRRTRVLGGSEREGRRAELTDDMADHLARREEVRMGFGVNLELLGWQERTETTPED